MSTHANRVQMSVSGTPGTGTITLNAATTGYRTFASAYGGNATVDVLIVDGTAWEVARDCTYTNSGTTLTRGTLESSSTGSAISLSSSAVVSVIPTADWGNRIEALLRQVTPGGRLTLVSGSPVADVTNAVAVSGQDTGADTITVTAHGWAAGTVVTSSATSGGVSASTPYYVGNVTTNTVSLHTTAANALAGTSKLDITGTVTATITAVGVSSSTLYYTPDAHDGITLWDGANWRPITFSETSVALSGLTASLPYDVFGYLSSGALAIELLAWTSDTARATAVTLQDGRYCKSGDKTRLLLGTIYSTGTNTAEDSEQNRYVWNNYNRRSRRVFCEITGSHTYASATFREWNAGAIPARVRVINGLREDSILVGAGAYTIAPTASQARVGIGENSTTSVLGYTLWDNAANVSQRAAGAPFNALPRLGHSYFAALQATGSGSSGTFDALRLVGQWKC